MMPEREGAEFSAGGLVVPGKEGVEFSAGGLVMPGREGGRYGNEAETEDFLRAVAKSGRGRFHQFRISGMYICYILSNYFKQLINFKRL